MNALRTRLGLNDHHEGGLSIVEVVVAMFIFAIISTGSIYTMLAVLQTTRDSRAGQVATNLAAQEIDFARDHDDLFKLLPTTYTVPLNGDTFTVTRETEWVSAGGTDVACGTGGGTLSYKRVNVTVTWDNMRNPASAVHSDTVIDPQSRITDPSKGTILVFVRTDGGAGTPGVKVTATPSSTPNGATTPSPNSVMTDASGCAYLLKVAPGNYDIALSHSSGEHVDENQDDAPVKNLGVQKSATASVGFQYDRGGTLQVLYASNHVDPTRPLLPTDLDTSFSSTYGTYVSKPQTGGKFLLHPFASGYEVITGRETVPTTDPDDDATCRAVNPAGWSANAAGKVANPAPTVAAPGGSTVNVEAPMGVVQIDFDDDVKNGDQYLRAVSVDSLDNGNPGCAQALTYRFGRVFGKSKTENEIGLETGLGLGIGIGIGIGIGGDDDEDDDDEDDEDEDDDDDDDDDDKSRTITIALPFGSWKLYADNNNTTGFSNNKELVQNRGMSVTLLTNGRADGDVVTLDPRPAS